MLIYFFRLLLYGRVYISQIMGPLPWMLRLLFLSLHFADMLITLNCYALLLNVDRRCRGKAIGVWRLRGAPPFGDPRKAWVSDFLPNIFYRMLDSVVGTITRLRGAGRFAFRIPAGVKDFSVLQNVQTGSGSHPASCSTGTGSTFPGNKAAGSWGWLLAPSSAEVKSSAIPLLFLTSFMQSTGTALPSASFFIYIIALLYRHFQFKTSEGRAPKFVFVFGPELCLSSLDDSV